MSSIAAEKTERQFWLSVLAKAEWPELEKLWSGIHDKPAFSVLRKPETGLVMLRGRTGGTGSPFNVGEATVTRCSVKIEDRCTGHAYILGRNHQQALAVAEIDATLQDERRRKELMDKIIRPLEEKYLARLYEQRSKSAATKVDFFTMVRGED